MGIVDLVVSEYGVKKTGTEVCSPVNERHACKGKLLKFIIQILEKEAANLFLSMCS